MKDQQQTVCLTVLPLCPLYFLTQSQHEVSDVERTVSGAPWISHHDNYADSNAKKKKIIGSSAMIKKRASSFVLVCVCVCVFVETEGSWVASEIALPPAGDH